MQGKEDRGGGGGGEEGGGRGEGGRGGGGGGRGGGVSGFLIVSNRKFLGSGNVSANKDDSDSFPFSQSAYLSATQNEHLKSPNCSRFPYTLSLCLVAMAVERVCHGNRQPELASLLCVNV